MRVTALRFAIPTFYAIALSFGGCTSVRPVREGVLYRSGQLSPTALETTVRDNNIRTVVNLRGKQPDAKWYQDEKRVLRELGVKQVDLSFESTMADPDAVADLLSTFKDEEKPILVHSHWSHGSVGFASGLYRVAVENEKPDLARKELAFWQTQRLPFMPGADQDRYLADWRSERRSPSSMIAAKRKVDSSLQDAGFDELDRPMKESAVAAWTPPKRFPWTAAPERSVDTNDSDAPTVVLGKPRPIPDDRIADRTDSRRY